MAKCRDDNCASRAATRKRGYCDYHYLRLPDVGYRSPDEARQRVRDLQRAGYSYRDLAALSGLDDCTLRLLGKWTDNGQITMSTHATIMAIPFPSGFVDGNGLIPNVGTRRRVEALMAYGYSGYWIAEQLNIRQQNVSQWLKVESVKASTARRVADLFSRYYMTPGPSERAATAAKKRGFHPPMAWDEDTIDDPEARPHSLGYKKNRADFPDEYREMREMGWSDDKIADHLGVTRDAVLLRMRRHERKQQAA